VQNWFGSEFPFIAAFQYLKGPIGKIGKMFSAGPAATAQRATALN